MIAYRGMLDVPRDLVGSLSALRRTARRARRPRTGTRALPCGNQALVVLAWFRQNEDLRVGGARFGISRATADRYRDEGLAVLAEQAADLQEARDQVATEGWSPVNRLYHLRDAPPWIDDGTVRLVVLGPRTPPGRRRQARPASGRQQCEASKRPLAPGHIPLLATVSAPGRPNPPPRGWGSRGSCRAVLRPTAEALGAQT